jgi:tRNA G10  N-methylase Trm11
MSTPGLTVWPIAQTAGATQRRGRYVRESTAHSGKMLPALARRAIETYTGADDLVVDPMCGIGTTLVEAVHLGRRAIGVELEPRWTALAARNVSLARSQGGSGQALAMHGDARDLGRGLLDDVAGQVALVLTSPPYGPSTHGHIRKLPGRIENTNVRYSDNRTNLGQLSAGLRAGAIAPRLSDALLEILRGCHRILRPGGRVVLTVRPYRHRGSLVDLPGAVTSVAHSAGFSLEPAMPRCSPACATTASSRARASSR